MNKSQSADFSPLGKTTAYVSQYNPELLFAIARVENRSRLGIAESLPFYGEDVWTAYEISWLDQQGKPQVAAAEFSFSADSPNIIESKSLKLYLNSLNQTAFDSTEKVRTRIAEDLSAAAKADVKVKWLVNDWSQQQTLETDAGYQCIDELNVTIQHYLPEPSLLSSAETNPVKESLVSHLLKSNCPVTGQPDWASLYIDYQGPQIVHEGLLAYLISFREHSDFHEHCVERIFIDISERCKPQTLTVAARYLRRGGLDINPVRSSQPGYRVPGRTVRQ